MADRGLRGDLSAEPTRSPRRRVRSHTVKRTLGGRLIIAEGVRRRLWSDFYHYAMEANWAQFVGSLAAGFFVLNACFATVYWLGDAPIANAHPGSWGDLFFFSVETTSTVGYGDMHPQTMFGHIVATVENFVGVVSLALMTGAGVRAVLRPHARLIFARNPVVSLHDGVQTLAFRVANERDTFIAEATAQVWMLGPLVTKEKRQIVGFQPMRLTKSENPMFALTWTLFHPIDEASPLFGRSADEIAASDLTFLVSLSGYDESAAQNVKARQTYSSQDLRFDHEFVDVITLEPNGARRVNYARVHDVRSVGAEVASS